MFEHLRQLLRDRPRPTTGPDERQLAAAVLLLEVARADYDHQPVELATLRAGLAREFGLSAEALEALLGDAQRRAHEAVSLYEFVETLNRTLAPDDKRALLQLLWDVAHADGRIDPQEEHLVRRLAELMHLSHADFIRAKLAR